MFSFSSIKCHESLKRVIAAVLSRGLPSLLYRGHVSPSPGFQLGSFDGEKLVSSVYSASRTSAQIVVRIQTNKRSPSFAPIFPQEGRYVGRICWCYGHDSLVSSLYPIEFIRTRLAMDVGSSSSSSSPTNKRRQQQQQQQRQATIQTTAVRTRYTGLRDVLQRILKSDGVLGLFQGYV